MNHLYKLIIGLSIISCANLPEESTLFETQTHDSIETDFESQSFEEFYVKFITDSTFQMSRISFPLNGNFTDYTNHKAWAKEKWPLITWDYRNIIENTDDSISVVQTDSTFYFGTFCRECGFSFWMEFEKLNGQWLLTSRQENNY
jgi:hypothetical protein